MKRRDHPIRTFIAKCILGVFAFDERNDLVDNIIFKGSVEEIADRMGSNSDEGVLAVRLKEKGFEVVTEAKVPGFEHDPENLARRLLAEKMFDLALDLEVHSSKEEVQARLREISLHLAVASLGEPRVGKEQLAIQAVRALDDMDKVIDRLGQRLREWFLAEYPEFTDELPEPRDMAENVTSRYAWTTSQLHRDNLGRIEKALSSNEGEEGQTALHGLAIRLGGLFEERDSIEILTQKAMEATAPNLSEVAGPILSARLISEAGGLEALAKMAATTVQILGAKRAVFRHLRSGDRPPKHGLIFIHPTVSQARPWQRGKISKTLSSILVRAARADAFGEIIAGHHLKKELEKKVEAIKAKRLEAPAPKMSRPRSRGHPVRRPKKGREGPPRKRKGRSSRSGKRPRGR